MEAGQICGGEDPHGGEQATGQQNAERATDAVEQQRFDAELANQPGAARAERPADGKLAARAAKRASSRLVTLAHAMSRRNAAALNTRRTAGRTSPTVSSRRETI